MRKVLTATDGSDGALRANDVAARIAKAFQAGLYIVYVSSDYLSPDQFRELERLHVTEGDALDAIAERILNEAKARAQEIGVSEIHVKECVGDPAEELLETIQKEQVDAIVVGRRGRGRLARLLLGSVSQKLASLAPCIVMIVP